MKHFESSENTRIRTQNEHPPPEIPHERRENSRVPARVYDVEGGVVCFKNSTFSYFVGTAYILRLRNAPPIMACDNTDSLRRNYLSV